MIRKFILRRIDRNLAKLGFTKISEDVRGIYYQRIDYDYDYIHIVSIGYDKNGDPTIQSYQKEINDDGFNNMVGLTMCELKLFVQRMKGWCSSELFR